MELKKVKAKDEHDPYLSKFYQEEYCSPFPEWLKNKIELMHKGTNLFAWLIKINMLFIVNKQNGNLIKVLFFLLEIGYIIWTNFSISST